jgi:hypothetical protein
MSLSSTELLRTAGAGTGTPKRCMSHLYKPGALRNNNFVLKILKMSESLLTLFRKTISYGLLSIAFLNCKGQRASDLITIDELQRTLGILSADSMEGRGIGTSGIERAAAFIATEFKNAGLAEWTKGNGFFQSFELTNAKALSIRASFDNKHIPAENILLFSRSNQITIDQDSGYELLLVKSEDQFLPAFTKCIDQGRNGIILIDTTLRQSFEQLQGFISPMERTAQNIIIILASSAPGKFQIEIHQEFERRKLQNVIGVLPGKSKANEYLIFSAHYDHLGVGHTGDVHDSIYNGANDDASGVAALIALANHFHRIHIQERTILFVAFTAEESGMKGSEYFAGQLDPSQIIAMVNIEMIGMKGSDRSTAFLTGFDRSGLGDLMQRNLSGTDYTIVDDPYPEQGLFFRSDNISLAKLGIPAHTISSANMNNPPFYHSPKDEFSTLDFENVRNVTMAIAQATITLVNSKEHVGRIKKH